MKARDTLEQGFKRRALILTVRGLAFLAPAARAQAPAWGVFVCQSAIVGVAADPGLPEITYQYPTAAGCSETPVQAFSLMNVFDSGPVVGMGPGYSDTGDSSVSGTATLGTLNASASATAISIKGIATAE